MSFDKHMERLAPRLSARYSRETLSPEARTRMLAALPDGPIVRQSSAGGHRTTRRFALATIAAISVSAVGLLSSSFYPRPALAAVRAAVARTNTWHLSGWRIKEGKKLRWEVWGRRSPFFYREQIGDEVLVDDGRTRTQILPEGRPNHWSVGHPGAVLIRRSPGPAGLSPSDPRAGFLVGLGAETDALHPVPNNGTEAGNTMILEGRTEYWNKMIIEETTRLTVDRTTHLPREYRVEWAELSQRRGSGRPMPSAPPRTVAELTAAYDVPLLPGVEQAPAPPDGYAVADMTKPGRVARTGDPSVASANGLTIQGEVVGRDKEGNLYLRFRAWLGDQPMDPYLLPLRLFIDRMIGAEVAWDDTGRGYVLVSDNGFMDGERPHLWLTPLKKPVEKDSRPRSLTLHLNVELSGYERIGNSGRAVPVVKERMALTVALPAEDRDLGYDSLEWAGGANGRSGRMKLNTPFRDAIAQALKEHRRLYSH